MAELAEIRSFLLPSMDMLARLQEAVTEQERFNSNAKKTANSLSSLNYTDSMSSYT